MLLLFAVLLILVAVLAHPDVRGWMGEKATAVGMGLRLDAEAYRRIDNVIVPSRTGTTQIDHVVVSPWGIFVIETKNKKGWIFGSAENRTWTQVLYGKKYPFQNPLKQNYRHTRCLAEYLRLDHRVFHSVVWFVGDCTFKTAMPENVLASGLSAYIEHFSNRCLTDDQVPESEHALRALKDHPVATRSEHVQSLRDRHETRTAGRTTFSWLLPLSGVRVPPKHRLTGPLRPSTGEKVEVGLVQDARLLHGRSQIRGLGKRLRAAEVLCLKQQDDFLRVVRTAQQVLLGQACLGAFGKVRVVRALPFRKVPYPVPYEQKTRHRSSPVG
jgi:restriction system protein